MGCQILIASKNSSSNVIVSMFLSLSTLSWPGMALRKNCTTWAGLVCRMPQWLTRGAGLVLRDGSISHQNLPNLTPHTNGIEFALMRLALAFSDVTGGRYRYEKQQRGDVAGRNVALRLAVAHIWCASLFVAARSVLNGQCPGAARWGNRRQCSD